MRTKIVLGGLAALFLLAALGLYITLGLPGRGSGPDTAGGVSFFRRQPGEGTGWPPGAGAPPAAQEPGRNPGNRDAPAEPGGITPGSGSDPRSGSAGPGWGEPAPGGSPSPPTEGEVWQQYEPRLAALQSRYQGALDALVNRAYGDYQHYRTDKVKLLALVPAYIQRGSALEREADAEFNRIVAALEGDLRTNHLPLNLANDLRRQYRDLKQQKRRAILNRAWELIHSQAF